MSDTKAKPTKAGVTRAKLVDGRPYRIEADGTLVPLKDESDWTRVRAMTDEDIEAAAASDPDAAPIADRAWFDKAKDYMRGTEQVSLRIPRRTLDWFKAQGGGYQTRMKAVLAAYVDANS